MTRLSQNDVIEEMTIEELEQRLRPQQILFVHEYELDGNVKRAAIQAGYGKGKSGFSEQAAVAAGRKLLRQKNIADYRYARMRELYFDLNISRESIALRLNDVYIHCMEGIPHVVWNSETQQYQPDGTYSFDSRGATKALELLGKSVGMFTENISMTGNVGVQIVNDIPKNTG